MFVLLNDHGDIMAIKRRKQKAAKNKRKNSKPSLGKKVAVWSGRVLVGFITLTVVWVIVLRFVNPPITYLMVKQGFEWKSQGKGFKIEKDWLKYADISDNLKRAAIAGEDAYFMTHRGFDKQAIQKAMERNQSGESLRGGSTISQQVAKNVFLWPNRSWLRKGLEAYFTVLIEVFWNKQRILEVYLNVIEMGQGVYGAEAAAHYYFSKSARDLTKREAALMVAILPNPRRWDARHPSAYINRRANSIVRYLNHYSIP